MVEKSFAVILPNTDRYGSLGLAEKIRNAVESLNISHISSSVFR